MKEAMLELQNQQLDVVKIIGKNMAEILSSMISGTDNLNEILKTLYDAGEGLLQTGCKLQTSKRESFFRDGDILIGGDFVVHSEFTFSEPTYKEEPKPILCKGFHIRYYREVLATIFAIEEINQSPDLLLNITLGFRIFDSCMSEARAIQGTLELLSGKAGPVPGYSCQNHPLLAGIIGETMSSLTVPMAIIMGSFKYPQISHSAVLSTLSDKVKFPSFLRTVPGNTFQNIALARLIGHFHWTWVGMIISDDEVGLQGGQEIRRVNEENGGCVAFIEKMHLLYSKEKVLKAVERIRRHSVKVIIIHSAEMHVKLLLETIYAQNGVDKVLVFSALFAMTPGIFANQAWKILNGTLGLVPYTGSMPGFEAFLYNQNPDQCPGDIFIISFWEQAFSCRWHQPNKTGVFSPEEQEGQVVSCSGRETVNELNKPIFELNDLSYTYHSYAAAYAFAHALNALVFCTPGKGPFTNGRCADINHIRPWQILHYLKNLHFVAGKGEEIFFDANGDALASYDILNVQISPDGIFRLVKVGNFDSRAPEGQDITINRSGILWNDGSSQVPHSVCSESCPSGYRKAAREGQPACCFDCVFCSHGEFSNGTDLTNCFKCPSHQWSNEKRDQCFLKMTEFLSFEEPLGLAFTVSAACLTVLATSVLCIFIKYRDTPIVKANNRGLSYLLLIALICCFLCTFIFIGRPTRPSCMLRQTVFGVIFSISVSTVLAKTIVVVIAFKASNPCSPARKYLDFKIPLSIVVFPSLVQLLICTVWLLTYSPFPELNTQLYNEKNILGCNEGDSIFFYCMLGYLGLLATVSFIVAFLSRNLPGSFNEAKLITFSMLVFVSVWIAFIPAYMSTGGKYMVAVEVFAILCSSAGLLGCIFFPKCYIILLRPERNSRKYITAKS
ncbi:extracellular calcium-sensing receptor-like [Pleurodeles waltl]|uniref:extracellular calcium-sensing receptor-like n=1 Tax=Pleurodeles waltl TaxID=8319 RepID=UPI003709711A